jgi:hypothetical protein
MRDWKADWVRPILLWKKTCGEGKQRKGISMNVCDLNGVTKALVTILSLPILMLQPILAGISERYSLIQEITAGGGTVSTGMRWMLVREVLLIVFIFVVIGLLCMDTIRRVMFIERKGKNFKSYCYDGIMVLITLFAYYFIISIGLFVFMNILLPICREL